MVFVRPIKDHPEYNYEINDHQYTMKYYLPDGIPQPWGNRKTQFNGQQESCSNNVDITFDLL